jgi:hypothetical protein
MLAYPVPSLDLPAIRNGSDVDLLERAWILGVIDHPRSEENLCKVAMVVGILPASEEEILELERIGI